MSFILYYQKTKNKEELDVVDIEHQSGENPLQKDGDRKGFTLSEAAEMLFFGLQDSKKEDKAK